MATHLYLSPTSNLSTALEMGMGQQMPRKDNWEVVTCNRGISTDTLRFWDQLPMNSS